MNRVVFPAHCRASSARPRPNRMRTGFSSAPRWTRLRSRLMRYVFRRYHRHNRLPERHGREDYARGRNHFRLAHFRKRETGRRLHLYCKESGSTLRFLIPVVGALGLDAVFHMEGRLPSGRCTRLTRS